MTCGLTWPPGKGLIGSPAVAVLALVTATACNIDVGHGSGVAKRGLEVDPDGALRLGDEVVRIPAGCSDGQPLRRIEGSWRCGGELDPGYTRSPAGTIDFQHVQSWEGAVEHGSHADGYGGSPYALRSNYVKPEEIAPRVVEALARRALCPEGYQYDVERPDFVLCTKNGDEMVKVGDFWVDRYEASVWPGPDCSQPENQFGRNVDDYAIPDTGSIGDATEGPFACSIPGVFPSTFLTWFQAQQVCLASGKHLITNGKRHWHINRHRYS